LLARGLHSYHRPTRIEEALDLAAQGVVPLGGGTHLLASPIDIPNLLDLVGLGLSGVRFEDEDLVVGATTTLQDLADTPVAYTTTAGLLPMACRVHSASRVTRGMATLAGEAVQGDPDSELAAALLALNAVFLVAHRTEPRESPALRFLRDPAADLSGGGLVRAVVIPGAPHGAALERAAVWPSLPGLVAVAATTTFSGDKLARVRLAVTGLQARPARVLEAEAEAERTSGDGGVLERVAETLARLAPFRDDLWASADERRHMARALALRALRTAVERGRRRQPPDVPRLRPLLPQRAPAPMPYFTSGRLELNVNGRTLRADAEARTSLLDLLRGAGIRGVKAGCGAGRCGACTVLLDGRPVASCLTPAVRAQGRAVGTVEGLGTAQHPHPLQAAFAEAGAIQCGFCTPGLILGAKALLDAVPNPTEAEVRDALAGLCRCTGYVKPVKAVLAAAARSDA
jgi:aerobic-type carbon monoxide dehydrogenase small subunit (CoxS/CutS family)/CO/xanthine dehydrogenase FAD-binding subunit